ncbi:M1 family metallopeptidase [Mucilaginibacter myungsuensis]|uniref:Aminopeptidase N n=2 Tax=Mucilaginibacter myungsuensis TaxID=649104 RepID=A0A929L117_9SPHI|nr:M1 family metallopeptidase [Mucilaginibacter myungsuensis]
MAVAGVATIGAPAFAQAPPAVPTTSKVYRATVDKINDLVHTKLDVKFDYKKRYLYGKAWITLKPHQYPTDTLRLDAKGMDIKSISVIKAGRATPLKYVYEDSLQLNIKLDKVYRNNESYIVYIDYTSKPNELKAKGSAAISDAKGLYFINPDGTEKDKPTQIWTQGETESSSCWFPTIDKPNQKTTEEISMTVQSKYVTLSNGKLISQKKNADGTRTDTWQQLKPHSPYLFMMAVGDFKIYRDKWKTVPVDYYLEAKYAPYAKEIFGDTPEIIDFYSKILGVDYPWDKYAQIVCRDYVSGAMENTSATLHGEYVQATKRELLDAYFSQGQSTIAHELFHQWFGDYVTAESWSNLTVNESFADLSETLWAEHKYGQDAGDAHSYQDMRNYMGGRGNDKKDLVRFYYNDKEDVFDGVTYQKGGTILNMLRTYLGRETFYKGLNIYLKTNAFKNGEAHQLRLALEEASGKDLNWFFNQWYFGAGHPVVTIDYKWDAATKTQSIYLKQTQTGQIFTLPMFVDIYSGGKKTRHAYWMKDASDTISYKLDAKPELVNVDGDKKILWAKTDNKSLEEYVFQYFNAPLFLDRNEALTAAIANKNDKGAQRVLIAALKDKYFGLQQRAISALDPTNADIRATALPVLKQLAQSDANNLVKAAAIAALGKLKDQTNLPLFKTALGSQSLSVQGAAFVAMLPIAKDEATAALKTMDKESQEALQTPLIGLYLETGTSAEWPMIKSKISGDVQNALPFFRQLPGYLGRIDNATYVQEGVAILKNIGVQFKSQGAGPLVINLLTTLKAARATKNDNASVAAIDAAIKEIGN